MEDLTFKEMQSINGGSELSRAFMWFVGVCFSNPGKMAVHGESPMDIQGFK